MKKAVVKACAVVLFVALSVPSIAEETKPASDSTKPPQSAQAEVSPPVVRSETPQGVTPAEIPAVEAQNPAGGKKSEDGRFAWFTLVPRYYFAGYGDSKTFGAADVAGAKGGATAGAAAGALLATNGIPAHNAHVVQFNLDMGGDGLGFELAPYLGFHDHATAMGAFVGFAWRLSFMDGSLYPGFGFGTRLGYFMIDNTDLGVEITPRIPLSVSYYFMDDLAATVEAGVGYGMLGYKTSSPDNFALTTGLYYDVGLGIRWP